MRISNYEGVIQDLQAKAKLSCTGLQEGAQELEKLPIMKSWNLVGCMEYI